MLFSKVKWQYKLVWILSPVLIVFLFSLIQGQSRKPPSEIFLIPENYRGKVLVIFEKACGTKKEFEKGKRVYRIPENGIMLTRFKYKSADPNYREPQYFFLVDKQGNRKPIQEMNVQLFNEEWMTHKNPNEPSRDSLGIFYLATNDYTNHQYGYSFYICTFRQYKENFGDQYYKRFDSLQLVTQRNCGNL